MAGAVILIMFVIALVGVKCWQVGAGHREGMPDKSARQKVSGEVFLRRWSAVCVWTVGGCLLMAAFKGEVDEDLRVLLFLFGVMALCLPGSLWVWPNGPKKKKVYRAPHEGIGFSVDQKTVQRAQPVVTGIKFLLSSAHASAIRRPLRLMPFEPFGACPACATPGYHLFGDAVVEPAWRQKVDVETDLGRLVSPVDGSPVIRQYSMCSACVNGIHEPESHIYRPDFMILLRKRECLECDHLWYEQAGTASAASVYDTSTEILREA